MTEVQLELLKLLTLALRSDDGVSTETRVTAGALWKALERGDW